MESGGKIWTCLLKLHSTCPKEHFEKKQLLKVLIFFKLFTFLNEDSPCLAKKLFGRDMKIENCSLRLKRSIKKSNFWKFLFFFQNLQKFKWTFIVLGEKFFGRDIKIEKCSLRLKRSIKKSNFWKFSFFSKSSELWTNIYCAWRENFRQGYQNWKMQFSSHKINQKIKILKVLFIYQTLQNFERTFTLLGEKVLGRDIKNENCTLCIQSIMLGIKITFSMFCKFSFYSDLEHKFFGFVATKFSPELSKLHFTCLFEFFLRCWY